MASYNHLFSIGFSAKSHFQAPANISAQHLRHAILDRLAALTDSDLLEAVFHESVEIED